MKKTAIIICVLLFTVLSCMVTSAQDTDLYLREITGFASGNASGVNVTLSVYPEEAYENNSSAPVFTDMIFYAQTLTEENGAYRFFVSLDFSKHSYYSAYVKVSGEETLRRYILKPSHEIYETFDTYIGGIPQGFNKINGRDDYFTKSPSENALCINASGKEGVVARYFDGGVYDEGVIYLSYKFNISTLGGMLGVRLLTEDFTAYNKANELNMDESIYMLSDGTAACYYGTRGWDSLCKAGTYTAGTWHKVAVWIDLDKDRITYYLDDKLLFETTVPDNNYKGVCWAYEGSTYDLYLDDIVIKKTDNTEIDAMLSHGTPVPGYLSSDIDVMPKAFGAEAGNIFFGDAPTRFDILIENTSCLPAEVSAKSEVYDSASQLIWSCEDTLSIKAGMTINYTILPQTPAYGLYSLKITAGDTKYTTSYSRCALSDELNPDMGVNVHFNWPTWADTQKSMRLIRNAGFGITRSGWETNSVNNAEQTDFIQTSEFGRYLDMSDEYDMDILAKVDDNGIYRTDNSNIVTGDEELLKVEAYYKWLAETYGDKVKYVEVRNECDLEIMADTPLYSCADYAKVLKAVYRGIKSGNKDIKVIAFASAIIREDFFELMFAEEMFDPETNEPYFDIISVHPYHRLAAPEDMQHNHGDGTSWFENWYDYSLNLYEILSDYGLEDIECWASEIGWDNTETSEEDQASYSVRVMLLNDIYGCFDKMLFYNLQDNGTDADNVDHNYGLTHCWYEIDNPYSAKGAYLALANYNRLLGGFEYIGCDTVSSLTETAYKSTYRSGAVKRTAVWSTSGSQQVSIELDDVNYYAVYDIYGNKTIYENTDGICTVNAGEQPVYVEQILYEIGLYDGDTRLNHITSSGRELELKVQANTDFADNVVVVGRYIGGNLVAANKLEFDNSGKACVSFTDDTSFDEIRVFVLENTETVRPLTAVTIFNREDKR